MPDVSFVNLLVVVAVAVLAPLTVGYLPRLRIPAVVLEIIGGIIIGPSVLGWVHVDLPVAILALFGLAFLLFLAGLEIDVHRLRGRLLRFAVLGYLVTLVLGYGAGASFTAIGWVSQPLLLAIMLSATSLGLVVPVLKDAGQVHSQVGQTALAAASIADFAAIVLLSLFFSSSGGSTGSKVVVLGAFAGLVAVTALVVSGAARSEQLGQVLVRLQDTTAEIRVRFAVLLLVAFTVLAERFGLESILGAFLAGAIVGLVDRDSSSHPRFRVKLEAIGYGFLVPVFFVSSGIRLDLTGLLHNPSALVRVPVFLLALLVVRGLPALLGLRANGPRSTLALGLLQATSLPFIVTATQIGVALGKITPVTAAALVCAGLLSVLIFPLLALGMLRSGEPEPAEPESAAPGAGGRVRTAPDVNGYTVAGPRSGGTAEVAAPWRRATRGESRWPAVLAVLAASALQMALPGWLSLGPHWLLPALELGLLCALVTSSPGRLERRSAALRAGGLALAGLLSLANAISTALLVNELAHGSAAESAAALLLASGIDLGG